MVIVVFLPFYIAHCSQADLVQTYVLNFIVVTGGLTIVVN